MRVTRSQLKRYPELLRIEEPKVQVELLIRATREAKVQLMYFMAFAIAIAIGRLVLRPYLIMPLLPGIGRWPAILVEISIGAALGNYWTCARIRRALRKGLREQGIAVCIHCGYDTRDLPENRCPECGTPFEPVEPREQDGSAD